MCVEYEEFDIIEVAKMCCIRFHHIQRNNVEFKALCPFCDDTKYHMGLNRQKGMFHCFRCKESGNSVSLYAKLNGISNKEAYAILKNSYTKLKPKENLYICSDTETKMRSLADRHDVYYDFLSMLKLSSSHRENLQNRGLSFKYIHRFMYKSMPTDDVFRREVLENLSKKHNLIGIPGFYRDNNGDYQMYIKKCGGIFIPICDKEGYIQGLQMRLDISQETNEKKFRWFSSNHFHDGTGAKPWIHVVGDTNSHVACLTEGAMKADITSVLSDGQLFIAVPGVNAINQLTEVIKDMRIRKVYEAFDMDKRSKPEVKDALITLRNTLNNIGVECVGCEWNPEYKGIDDYFYAKTNYYQSMPIAA